MFGKFSKSLNTNKQMKKLLFFKNFVKFLVIIIFMIFQLILLVLLTPTNSCFQDQLTPPSDRIWVVNQTFTNFNMVYRVDGFYKSKCPSVCLCVRLCVCVSVCSLMRNRLNIFLPPLPEVSCLKFLEIRNPWGNLILRRSLRCEYFCSKRV